MNAIILENEYQVDREVVAFLNSNPTLFASVEEYICCKNRSLAQLKQPILECDAIVLASTFMYIDQLNEYLDAFLSPNFPSKIIYVNGITGKLNNWKYDSTMFLREVALFEKVKQLLAKGTTLYSYYDGWGEDRGKVIASRVIYSTEHDVFFDGEMTEQQAVNIYILKKHG
jgi:hypothetical protein